MRNIVAQVTLARHRFATLSPQPAASMFPMNLLRAFTDHPASVGETYTEHLARATCFGVRMIAAGIACLVHALLPFLFERTGSAAIAELNDRMVVNRRSAPPLASTPRLPL
jgi:hypothetical protein